jgi:hypothetical protein
MKPPLRQDKSRKGGGECDLKPFVAIDLLRESRSWRYSRRKILRPDELSGLL